MNYVFAFRSAMLLLLSLACSLSTSLNAQTPNITEYVLGPGDVIHVTVFNNPELTTDARISETGAVSFPLIGNVFVLGLSISQAQDAIAKRLSDGHFVQKAQVNILPTAVVGSQVTVVGHVNRPGRYPLQTTNTHISDALALAGGVDTIGADAIVFIQHHSDGTETRTSIDTNDLFTRGTAHDQLVQGGDTLYVPHEPEFYVYGEVQHPGSFRLERHMTLMQGLALGGFVIQRGSERRTQIFRQDDDGKMHEVELGLNDMLMPNDTIYVRSRIL